MAQEEYTVVGKRLPRIDSVDKVTGTAAYLGDLKIPGLLWGKILRSPYPHARILKVDTSRAERLPGVRAVATGRDTHAIRLGVVQKMANKSPLAEDKVRFIGDEIAAVAADDEDIAEEALDLIEVEYEELPAVFDPIEAMKSEAIKIHEEGNVAVHRSTTYGDSDMEKAFKESDHIFEDRFETQARPHCCSEPNGCIAHFDQTGKLTLWATTQWPHPLRMLLADTLGIPFSKIRVIKVAMGGGFGGRGDAIDPIHIVGYVLSKKANRPVRVVYTHDEQLTTGRYACPMIIDIKTGVKKDGTLLARDVKVVTDQGAYNGFPILITMGIGTKCTYLWGVPNVKFEGYVVFTNKVYGGAFRGFGNPQITFAIESHMDMIAEELGMDMTDLCLKNANYEGQVTCMNHKVTSCDLKDCIEQAAEACGWNEKRRKPGDRGVGMASLMHTGGGIRNLYGDCNLSDVFIKMNNDGTIDLASGAAEIGQGSDTVLAQIAAEEVGIRIEDVNVITGDTSTTPQDLGAWGSREVFIAGNAAKMAGGELKQRLFEEASEILGAPVEDLIARDRKVYVKQNPEKSVSTAQVATTCYNRGRILAGRGCYDDPSSFAPDPKTGYGGAPTYGFGTHAVEVEVDKKTGQVKVLNYVAAHDLGKAINPMMAEGQIEGGAVQGLGYALSEGLVWEEGIVLNSNFQDYRIFFINDVPPIKSILVESIDPDGPYGAKGLGEPTTIPTAAAVASAIYDAVGVRIKTLPITPEKILRALKEKDEEQ
jgi:4-hydroxybenzoyl-CoA reductase alpha subunit